MAVIFMSVSLSAGARPWGPETRKMQHGAPERHVLAEAPTAALREDPWGQQKIPTLYLGSSYGTYHCIGSELCCSELPSRGSAERRAAGCHCLPFRPHSIHT
ncbi:hypothetical protein QTO34_002104 [Cnephaeus nilssonii]|uniref:Uncharacterized protein n=1 Tax=Cnephaeus nilssonii TaxID=3371016 RepID=A0AA40HV47_CNENI|nr:hypothetical protein QTO34_002104 [Eptesicus nilssonii]